MVDSDSARVVTWEPIVVTGDNSYVAWWTNKTTANNNDEVMFRASNGRGQTFGGKINLSNSPEADSYRVEISAEGQNVAVSWWETTNQTSDTPVARISTDGGHTFGPVLRLASNGTISSTSATGIAGTTILQLLEEEQKKNISSSSRDMHILQNKKNNFSCPEEVLLLYY